MRLCRCADKLKFKVFPKTDDGQFFLVFRTLISYDEREIERE